MTKTKTMNLTVMDDGDDVVKYVDADDESNGVTLIALSEFDGPPPPFLTVQWDTDPIPDPD